MQHNRLSGKLGIIIAIVFVVSIFTCLGIGKSLVWGLTLTLLFTVVVLKQYKIPYKQSVSWIIEGIGSIKAIYIVVIMIGINVAVWTSSGIVPGLIYYGFEIVDQVYFLLFSFLLTGVVAFFLGTGLGTLSTAGIAIFSLGLSIGLPKGILVGALLSGAYIADRLSPISALVNFTLETTGVSFKRYFKQTAIVMLPAAIVSAFFYYLLSLKYPSSISTKEIIVYKDQLIQTFQISPALFLIPLIILWTSFKGMKTMKVLGIGILLSSAVTVFIQGNSFMSLLGFMATGFKSGSEFEFIRSLEIGGAMAMLEVVIIIMAGISMSMIYEKCGWIDPIIQKVVIKSKTKTQVVFNTGILSILLNALTCDQTVGILVPGKYLQNFYKSKGLSQTELAQVIANTGTAVAPLMPWNVNAIIILAITGVGAIEFAPYAFLNWLTLPATVLMIGIMTKRSNA